MGSAKLKSIKKYTETSWWIQMILNIFKSGIFPIKKQHKELLNTEEKIKENLCDQSKEKLMQKISYFIRCST